MPAANDHPGDPNVYFLYSAAMAGLVGIVWPEPGAYFGQGLIAGTLGLAAAIGGVKGLRSLKERHRRRMVSAQASSRSTSLGAARFAGIWEREAASLHDPSGQLLVGLADDVPVFLPAGRHLAVEAGPGAGKTSCLVSAALWHAAMNGTSVVVSDPKPELAYLWADALRKAGFRVVFNNPAFHPDFEHANTNPFAPVIEAVRSEDGQRDAFTIAESLALALIPETKNDKNKFFTQNDRNAFVAMLLCLAVLEPEACYPSQLYRWLIDPRRFRHALLEARDCDALDGDLSALAANLLQKEIDNPEHLESARTGASHALSSFKPSSALGALGASHDFDPATLRDPNQPPVILFDIIPSDRLEVFGKANGLMQTARLKTLRRHREGRKVLFLCDEATNLPVPTVVADMELMRSFGVSIALFYQSFGSLKRVYGDDQAASILSSSVEIYFSVGDLQRAEDLSKRMGDITAKTAGFSFDDQGKPSRSIGEAAKKLLPPEEILALPKSQGLMLVPGLRPILFEKTPWYQVEPFKSLAGDNPHERHARSSTTLLTLNYDKDAPDFGPPTILGQDQRLASARRRERRRRQAPRASVFRLRDFVWVPMTTAMAMAVVFAGTPHLRFEYATGPDRRGEYACVYLGLSGFRPLRQPAPCKPVQLIRFPSRNVP